MSIDPANVEAWFSLGTVRVFLGQHAPAAEAFREALRLKPDHTLASHNLGICLKSLGDLEGARRAWRDALRSQPDYEPSRKALEEAAMAGTK